VRIRTLGSSTRPRGEEPGRGDREAVAVSRRWPTLPRP